MLENIKSLIHSTDPYPDFEEYFLDYLMNTQDDNLSSEIFRRFKDVNISADNLPKIDNMINELQEEMTQ